MLSNRNVDVESWIQSLLGHTSRGFGYDLHPSAYGLFLLRIYREHSVCLPVFGYTACIDSSIAYRCAIGQCLLRSCVAYS